jgi:cyclopropane fatty-acyl-phospholipid synthase-like methyltransferase
MKTVDRWRNFWSEQNSPLHRYNNEKWYRLYAKEINLLIEIAEYDGGPVLETGCGSGSLYKYLSINKDEYVGVDLSERMLEVFRSSHQGVSLICSDGSSYSSTEQYSLIFSNGVIQYFDRRMLANYIKNSLNMLKQGGILLIVNIPWKELRSAYASGELGSSINPNWVKKTKTMISGIIRRSSSMGNWYNPRDFLLFKKKDIKINAYGSIYHPYRFSIIMKREHSTLSHDDNRE